jgi:hypothetical protein
MRRKCLKIESFSELGIRYKPDIRDITTGRFCFAGQADATLLPGGQPAFTFTRSPW